MIDAKGNYTHVHPEWAVDMAFAYVVLELIGSIGAVIIVLTMVHSNAFIITYRVYLSLAALIDIFMMYVLGGNMVLKIFTNYNTIYDMILQSDISCRVYHVLLGFITHFNVWIHTALMIELFVICVFPKKLNSVSSMERAHYLSLLLLSVLLILNMNYFWTIKRQKEPLGLDRIELCYFDSSFEKFETKIYPVIEGAVIGVIPVSVWLCLVIYTARRFYKQGATRPGGLLISTKEYWKISYSMSTIYLMGHLPRFIWQLHKYVKYTTDSQKNPGISTLQNFHTELIDGDPWFNLPLAVVMAFRFVVLLLVSEAFRSELRKAVSRFCCCCCDRKKYSIASGLSSTYQLGSTPLMQNSRSEASTLYTKASRCSAESLV